MKTQDMSGDDGGKSDCQENDICFDQASDEDGEIEKGSDFVEESSQNECEEKKEKRQTQTPVKKTVWVLVFEVEENKHNPPILLEDVQDKSGRNGVKANLKKHDKVLYDAGGKLREAFIVSQSDNKEKLDEMYKEMMELKKLIHQKQSNGNLWHYTKVIVVCVAGGLTVAVAPLVFSAAGFTAGGIGAGSAGAQLMSWSAIANAGGIGAGSTAQLMSWSAIANGGGIGAGSIAELMSWSAIANGGGLAAGGMFRALQLAGMAGIATATHLLSGTSAGTARGALTHYITLSEKPGSSEESEHQCFICLDDCKMYTALKPCGHQFTCESCAGKLRKCPICKTPIQN